MKILLIILCAIISQLVVQAEPVMDELVQEAGKAIVMMRINSKANDILLATKPRPVDFDTKWEALSKERALCYAKLQALKDAIKLNSSIFEYPGLLALGEVGYNKREMGERGEHEVDLTYSLKFHDGYSDCSGGGSESRFYLIRFDSNGKITFKGRLKRMLE